MLLHKYRDVNASCVAIIFGSVMVRGGCPVSSPKAFRA